MNNAPFTSLPIYTAATTIAAPPPPPTMPEPNESSPTAPIVDNGVRNRSKSPQPPVTVSSGSTCFRLLCHASRIGGVIGKSGCIIKRLQKETSAKIRVEDSPLGYDDRVIYILADSTVYRTMSFDEENNQENNFYVDDSEYTEVSVAQEALIRVYEMILNAAAETDGGYFAPGGVVSCRLLADETVIGFLIGKRGENIKKVRKHTGCKIRTLGQEKLPSCALATDVLIEIEGNIVAVKKALIAISRRVQDCPPFDKTKMFFDRPHKLPNGFNHKPTLPNGYTQEPTLQNGYTDFPPARTQIQEPAPISSPNYVLRNINGKQEIVFRLICLADRVGGVIGNSGTIVQALQNQSGAHISASPPQYGCDERLITISAFESQESRNSPAQNGVIRVFTRSVEAAYEKGLDSPTSKYPISAKLVIPHHQTGCLLGKHGSIIADMRKVTGAFIKIIRNTSESDQIVLMQGEFVNVQDALYSVTSRLRNYIFSSNMTTGPNTRLTYGNGQPVSGSHHFNEHANLTQSMDNLKLFDHQSSCGPSQSQDVDKGSSSKGCIELGRGSRSAIITNTTVEIMVAGNAINSVYGENGSNLTHLRQISGAKVVIHETGSGLRDHVVVISGTPDQAQSAQSLLQAFILADQQ